MDIASSLHIWALRGRKLLPVVQGGMGGRTEPSLAKPIGKR